MERYNKKKGCKEDLGQSSGLDIQIDQIQGNPSHVEKH